MKIVSKAAWLCSVAIVLFGSSLAAAPVSTCATDFTSCDVYEGQLLTLPGLGISGDVIVRNSLGSTVDVFRLFNNTFDSGLGTGLGNLAFLYGADLNNLPNPSTYSANASFLLLGRPVAGGYYETDYNGNGTIYRLYTPTPEPSTVGFIGLGIVALSARMRFLRRRKL
jgi:PEP-CTERM motif